MTELCRHTVELRQHELEQERLEREWNARAEERAARRDELTEDVLTEISEGKHDDELLNSPFVDLLGVMRIARRRAANLGAIIRHSEDINAMRDLNLQIETYARDLAERRMLDE